MNKLKVGDKCRVIANTTYHGMEIGHETKVDGMHYSGEGYEIEGWAVEDDDVELIEPVNNQEDAR